MTRHRFVSVMVLGLALAFPACSADDSSSSTAPPPPGPSPSTTAAATTTVTTSMEGDGYDGPARIEPTNVEYLRELRLIENFEGMHQWAIGLDRQRPFEVTTLVDPPRIVIDVAK